MVLVLTKAYDVPVKLVISQLIESKVPYVLLVESDVISNIYINLGFADESIILEFNGSEKVLDLLKVTAYWYRNGFFPLFDNRPLEHELFERFKHYINIEQKHLTFFLHKKLKDIPSIGSFFSEIYSNKLVNLDLAVKAGLKIPQTYVVQKKDCLGKQIQATPIITKAIQREMYYCDGSYEYFTVGTQELSNENLNEFPRIFPPSLIQEKIEKEYEIRSFYLLNTFYSMILFSQEDQGTALDYRHFNEKNPIRCMPYKLPQKIERKLKKILTWLNINTGSFDLIYTKQKEYVFLEVNPSGQYHFLSEQCNYQVETKIAQFLVDNYRTFSNSR